MVTATGAETAQLAVTVTNSGPRAGAQVVQAYIATEAGPVRRPTRQLAAFTKVYLKAGESTRVTLDLDRRAFAYYDVPAGRWLVAPGEYTIQIGESSADIVTEQALSLAGEVLTRQLSLDATVAEWASHPVVGPTLLDELASAAPGSGIANEPELLRLVESMPMAKVAKMLGGPALGTTLERLLQRAASSDAGSSARRSASV
jgi:beta-glucosidase